MTLLLQQISALTEKNLLIIFSHRRVIYTYYRVHVIPILFACYIAFVLRLYFPQETYQIGNVAPVRSLADGMNAATGGRNTLALVNSGLSGGGIDRVINSVAQEARSANKKVALLDREFDLVDTCSSSLRGVTHCYGAVVFYSSPNEGPDDFWNYTIRTDAEFGRTVNLKESDNDAQIYAIPLQHAVDTAIASVSRSNSSLPSRINEYPYASETQDEFKDSITRSLQETIINVIACVFYLAFVAVLYQLVGLMAMERELGMSQLIESMMPNARHWEPQAARLISFFTSLSLVNLPAWVAMGIILKFGLFKNTSAGIFVIFFILAGFSTTSFSVLGGCFFKKTQLSGITVVLVGVGLAIIAQVVSKASTGTTIVLSLLFSPMTIVYFFIFMARHETEQIATNLLNSAPSSPWRVSGIVLWIFLIVQTVIYPLLGAVVERYLYDTASKGRTLSWQQGEASKPVRLTNVTKRYAPSRLIGLIAPFFRHRTDPVVAVNNLTMTAMKGQITVLLGANGSGKSTTLDLVAGLTTITGGSVALDGTGGVGVCPQKNVLWDDLSVEQHVTIFNKLKCISRDSKDQVRDLVAKCGLKGKTKALIRALSGGQKRKVQLMMMLTGGSRVCCVDEVSGGLDPLSRRHVWDILLAERGTRTVLLTTHFLDEAEYLADHICFLSKGSLKAEGSSVELKDNLGSGYRVEVFHGTGEGPAPMITLDGVTKTVTQSETTFVIQDTSTVLHLIKCLEEKEGIANYRVTSPTLQEVFLKLAEEIKDEGDADVSLYRSNSYMDSPYKASSNQKNRAQINSISGEKQATLQTGRPIGALRQAMVLFKKRFVIMLRNSLPSVAAVCIPIVAAGVLTLLLRKNPLPGCSRAAQIGDTSETQNLSKNIDLNIVIGPEASISPENLQSFSRYLSSVIDTGGNASDSILQSIRTVNTLDSFDNYIDANFKNVTPGGIFIAQNGSPPIFAYKADGNPYSDAMGGMLTSIIMQNALDVFLTNISIVTQYNIFEFPWANGTGDTLQVVFYFALAMSAYPAFFALYPTVERLRKVRALEYSNGVRALPLWLAYLCFDGILVLIGSVGATIIYAAAVSDAWYHVGYLFIIFFLYGIASILLSYVISLLAISQLAAFASSAGGQALMVVLYMTAYFQITANSPASEVNTDILIAHFSIATITPVGNLVRALLLGLNTFSILCEGDPPRTASNPGDIKIYGGPILYLILQSFFLFGILLFADSNVRIFRSGKAKPREVEETRTKEPEVSDEIQRVIQSNSGLRLLRLTKIFKEKFRRKSSVAVDDLTLGVMTGEVFALVGPNGAGKSTTLTMIRGEIQPDNRDGEIFVDDHSVKRNREIARSHLGVCPQFDAMDQMTVLDHLRFYAGVRGVQDIEHNVNEVVEAVGLKQFQNRVASKLSGGNKRKLSLGIALIGNPKVLLLDEPSSGMDPVAKRQMWKILSTIAPGRSILLTTHSMEEATALAARIGILAKRLLDIGSPQHLRRKHADGFHVHLITSSGINATDEEYQSITNWMQEHVAGVELDGRPYHGQMRFSIPVMHTQPQPLHGMDRPSVSRPHSTEIFANTTASPMDRIKSIDSSTASSDQITTGSLFTLLEANKARLGVEHYTVSPNTFDEVFLSIVRKHHVDEEDFKTKTGLKWAGWKKGFVRKTEEEEEAEHTESEGGRGGRRFKWRWRWLIWPFGDLVMMFVDSLRK